MEKRKKKQQKNLENYVFLSSNNLAAQFMLTDYLHLHQYYYKQ